MASEVEDDLTERVIQVIARTQHCAAETITPESTFAGLGIDSLDGLQILFALEEEFGVSIPDDASKQFNSVERASDGIRMLLHAKTEAASSAT